MLKNTSITFISTVEFFWDETKNVLGVDGQMSQSSNLFCPLVEQKHSSMLKVEDSLKRYISERISRSGSKTGTAMS